MRYFSDNKIAMTAVMVAVGLGLAGCGQGGHQGPPNMTPQVGVTTIKAERVELSTELPGRTAAFRIADIRPQVNGIILKRLYEEGSLVKAGDILYEIDPKQYQSIVDQAQAAVAMAEASLPAARSREARFKELVASRAVGQQDYDDALAALRQVEAQLAASKAALETARINLSYAPIKAPIAGQIGRSNVTEGALVIGYQPMPLATVQQLDPIYVDVPQSTAEHLRLQRWIADAGFAQDAKDHNKVKILLEDGSAYPEEGTLEFRDTTVNPTTGSVILRIVVPNAKNALLPGMFVRAVLKEGVIAKGILVPQSYISRTPKGDAFAWVVDKESKAQMQMVTVDRAIGNKWLITSGLSDGDTIIVDGIMRLHSGAQVTAVPAGTSGTDGKMPAQAPGHSE